MPEAKRLQLLTARLEPEGTSSPAPPLRQLDPPSFRPAEVVVSETSARHGDKATVVHAEHTSTHGSTLRLRQLVPVPLPEGKLQPVAVSPTPSRGGAGRAKRGLPSQPPLLAAGAILVVLVGLAFGVTIRSHAVPSAPGRIAEGKSAPSGEAGTHPLTECVVTRPATRLAASIEPTVPLGVARLGESTTVAMGYASSPELAIGLTVDAADLRARTVLRDRDLPAVRHVTVLQGGEASFAVDRKSLGAVRDPLTVPGDEPFTLRITDSGVVAHHPLLSKNQLIWELASTASHELHLGSLPGSSHVVAVAQTDSNRLSIGWLGPRGEKRSKLQPIPIGMNERGTPALGLNEHEALLVVAVRRSPREPWHLEAGIARWGAGVSEFGRLELPETTFPRQSPRIASFPGRRWVVQWTEGVSGRHTVKMAVLDPSLRLATPPLALSPAELDSGAGAIAVVDTAGVGCFVVKKETGYELWAAGFSCS